MVGEEGDEGPEALKREQRRLYDEITALEEDYETGTIDQKTYSGLNASRWKELTDIQRRINATKPLRTRTELVEEYLPTSDSFWYLGRVSLFLYLGAGLIALGGLLAASAIASVNEGQLPPSYSDYWEVVIIVGVAFVLVGFARQADKMHE